MAIDQEQLSYTRIAQAITYIKDHFRDQPSLNEIAATVNLSPSHFQRLFSDWAGVSPKKFVQYISLEYAKGLLKEQQSTLLDAAHETGLSGTSRLHDLFVNIEGMTPGEFKNGGASLSINYSFAETSFGKVIVGSTGIGVCHMAFDDDEAHALATLKQRFPKAAYHRILDKIQQDALSAFQDDRSQPSKIRLHLKGTVFQLKVWECLLKIPSGNLRTYGHLAREIGKPKASRAVGTAIGKNPVAVLIPCHRVIQGSGKSGGYMWGATRKSILIGWEAAQRDRLEEAQTSRSGSSSKN